MKLTVIGSGSKGNCYLIHNDEEALVLECGYPLKAVRDALKGSKAKIVGTLVTHEHADHAMYVGQWLDHGIKVYCSIGTAVKLKNKSKIIYPTPIPIDGSTTLHFGLFNVVCFETTHDAAEPCGFMIQHPDMGTLVFATDTLGIPVRFANASHIMIECNYDMGLLVRREDIPDSLKERIAMNHMSVDRCIHELQDNDLRKVQNIILIHISEGDGDPLLFREQVEAAVPGKNVVVASPGVELELKEFPF